MPARPTALAVVGRTGWHARRRRRCARRRVAAAAGRAASTAPRSSPALEQRAREADANDGGFVFYSLGDVPRPAQARRPAHASTQVYRAPYLAHAAMEPINCTARVADGKVEVWVPTQVPGLARAIAARVAGVPLDAVTVHVTYLGGGFGRRLDVDFVGQAVRIAIECGGRPVQLVWSREEDLGHDFYRPGRRGGDARHARRRTAGRARCTITSAGDAITPRWIERGLPSLAGPVDRPTRPRARACSTWSTRFPTSASPTSRRRAACRSATGARSATRTTPSSASRSSTSSPTPPSRTRSPTGWRC